MKTTFFIFLILLSLNNFSQTKTLGQLKEIDFKTHYFNGKKGKSQHTLIFNNDSTFHITVPAKGAGCFLWGEFGGNLKIKGDTIVFTFVGINQGQQLFIVKDAKTIKRISKEGFMCEKYKLAKW